MRVKRAARWLAPKMNEPGSGDYYQFQSENHHAYESLCRTLGLGLQNDNKKYSRNDSAYMKQKLGNLFMDIFFSVEEILCIRSRANNSVRVVLFDDVKNVLYTKYGDLTEKDKDDFPIETEEGSNEDDDDDDYVKGEEEEGEEENDGDSDGNENDDSNDNDGSGDNDSNSDDSDNDSDYAPPPSSFDSIPLLQQEVEDIWLRDRLPLTSQSSIYFNSPVTVTQKALIPIEDDQREEEEQEEGELDLKKYGENEAFIRFIHHPSFNNEYNRDASPETAFSYPAIMLIKDFLIINYTHMLRDLSWHRRRSYVIAVAPFLKNAEYSLSSSSSRNDNNNPTGNANNTARHTKKIVTSTKKSTPNTISVILKVFSDVNLVTVISQFL